MSYKAWLQKYISQDSPLGDFANDVQEDSSFPKGLDSLSELKSYLIFKRASTVATEVAIDSFKKYKKNNPTS